LGFYEPPPFVAEDEPTEGQLMSYRVIASLAIATDQGGHHRNYYHGAVIPWLSEAQAKHLVSHKLVEKMPEPVPAPAAPVPAGHHPAGKPAKIASKEAWVEYGVSKGQNRAELESLSKQDLIELLG
jgi:hypothetical protein